MSKQSTKTFIPSPARFSVLAVTALLPACASAPNTALLMARDAYSQAQADPKIAAYAPVPLHEAAQSLEEANRAKDKGEINHLAYMTRQRVELARAEAETKIAEEASKQQFKDREGMRVESLENELAALKAKKTERGYVVTLGDVLFDYNRSSLKPGAQQNLYSLITFLNAHQDRDVAIEGHTDSSGSASYNQELSTFRAQSVEGFLRQNGVQATRITTQGFGLSRPVASNSTEAGRQLNRRVEVIISQQDQASILRSGRSF